MHIHREMGAGAGSPPFLSIVTRCYRRPQMLSMNRLSLWQQTDQDWEQVFVVDETGEGVGKANRALAAAEPRGDYVMVLDDDDVLSSTHAIASLRHAAASAPELVIFRADHGPLGVLPDSIVWGRRPIHGRIGSCDFISRRDVWDTHIHAFGTDHSGDYNYLTHVWRTGPAVVWHDEMLARVQRISWGKPGRVFA